MPRSSGGSSYTAVIRIVITDKDLTRPMQKVRSETDKTSRSTSRLARRNNILVRTWRTMSKALISMVGVLIAFNLLITGPQFALQLLVGAFVKAIQYAAEFEKRIISLQSILASELKFDADPFQNFIIAGRVSEKIMDKFAMRAGETIASVDQVGIAFQTMIATGASRYAKTFSQLVDLSILMSNAVASLTIGQPFAKQIAEEIRSLLLGRNRPTAQLVNFLFGGDKAEFDAFMKRAREGNNLVEMLIERLSGFVFGAQRMGSILEGVRSTVESFWQVLSARALTQGGPLTQLLEFLAAYLKDIFAAEEPFNRLAANISAMYSTIGKMIIDEFGLAKYFQNAESTLEGMAQLMPWITEKVLIMVAAFKSAAQFVLYTYKLLLDLYYVILSIIRVLRELGAVEGVKVLFGIIQALIHGLRVTIRLLEAFVPTLQGIGKAVFQTPILVPATPGGETLFGISDADRKQAVKELVEWQFFTKRFLGKTLADLERPVNVLPINVRGSENALQRMQVVTAGAAAQYDATLNQQRQSTHSFVQDAIMYIKDMYKAYTDTAFYQRMQQFSQTLEKHVKRPGREARDEHIQMLEAVESGLSYLSKRGTILAQQADMERAQAGPRLLARQQAINAEYQQEVQNYEQRQALRDKAYSDEIAAIQKQAHITTEVNRKIAAAGLSEEKLFQTNEIKRLAAQYKHAMVMFQELTTGAFIARRMHRSIAPEVLDEITHWEKRMNYLQQFSEQTQKSR